MALSILRAAMARSGEGRYDGFEVRLAPRRLLHHCPERWPPLMPCDAAEQGKRERPRVGYDDRVL